MDLTSYRRVERELNSLPSQSGYMTRQRHPSFYITRTRHLLAELGNPELGFRYIHVGGTAGKGSVTVMLHSILHKAGKRVGAYISPHVTTLAERTLINGRLASVDDIVWAWKKVNHAIASIKRKKGGAFIPSYFEANVAMSMLLFKKYKLSWIILEVGCGGEFDATNVIPVPHVTVITNVYLDHTQLLGKTRKKIAQTKSGIIKRGTTVISGETDPSIRRIIKEKARENKASCLFISKQYQGSLALIGPHQQHNAAIAQAAARQINIPEKYIISGLKETKLPARFEIMQRHPFLILDGAHNPDKIKALKNTLTTVPYSNVYAVVGIGDNKNIRQMLRLFIPKCTRIIFSQSHQTNPKPATTAYLYKTAKRLFPKRKFGAEPNVRRALDLCLTKATKNDLILVTGSLYLAGEARKIWISEKKILSTHNLFPV